MSLNILEIRNYTLQPGMREHFIDYFETNLISPQLALGMFVLGQFRLKGEPDHFVWMRAYENMETRLHGLKSFYDGPVWQQHRATTNTMIVDSDNVHLLRPLDGNPDLAGGQSAQSIAAAISNSNISLRTGLIVVDFYEALPSKRSALIAAFQAKVVPAYQQEEVDWRGPFVAEMRENSFPRHPAIQNEHEFVVVTAYESEDSYQEQRQRLASAVASATKTYLSKQPVTLVLSPTLRSPLRYHT
ncbi:MAG: NIPSNAP family protein [Anaerolineae bacterium]